MFQTLICKCFISYILNYSKHSLKNDIFQLALSYHFSTLPFRSVDSDLNIFIDSAGLNTGTSWQQLLYSALGMLYKNRFTEITLLFLHPPFISQYLTLTLTQTQSLCSGKSRINLGLRGIFCIYDINA